jgi:hypothetical protein
MEFDMFLLIIGKMFICTDDKQNNTVFILRVHGNKLYILRNVECMKIQITGQM